MLSKPTKQGYKFFKLLTTDTYITSFKAYKRRGYKIYFFS